MVVKLRLVFSISIFFLCYCGFGQTKYWQKTESRGKNINRQTAALAIDQGLVFSLEKDAFNNELRSAQIHKSSKTISFPDENGDLVPFIVQ